jgi:uncharacterized membrane protein
MVFPPLVLAISFWVHFIAAVVWVGGSLITPLIISPVLGTLDPPARLKAMGAFSAKMMPLYTASIIAIILSGAIQIGAYGYYDSRSSTVLTIKLIVVLLMVANGLYIGLGLSKRIVATAPAPGTPPSPEFLKVQRSLVRHGWIQASMGIIVLLVTGFLRVGYG